MIRPPNAATSKVFDELYVKYLGDREVFGPRLDCCPLKEKTLKSSCEIIALEPSYEGDGRLLTVFSLVGIVVIKEQVVGKRWVPTIMGDESNLDMGYIGRTIIQANIMLGQSSKQAFQLRDETLRWIDENVKKVAEYSCGPTLVGTSYRQRFLDRFEKDLKERSDAVVQMLRTLRL